MKHFSQVLLLGCTIHNIAGYIFPFMTTDVYSNGPAEHHEIEKRQISDYDDLRRCQGTIWAEQCTSGQVQETVNIASQCNLPQAVTLLQNSCKRNHMGDYCGIASAYITTKEAIETKTDCVGAETTCSVQCQSHLRTIRDRLGCCINEILNDTSSPLYNPVSFSYSLWSSCGVEPAPNDCTDTAIKPYKSKDPNCTLFTYFKRAGILTCSAHYIEPIFKALSSNNCERYIQAAQEQCGVNEAGVPCFSYDTIAGYSRLTATCTTTTSCSEECRASLQSYKSSVGCCINNLFNGTAAEIVDVKSPLLTYEFWKQCGVSTPGRTCKGTNIIPTASKHSIKSLRSLLLSKN